MKMESKRFQSSDLHLAAYLMSLPERGLNLESVDRSNPQRVVFTLSGCPGDADLAAYAKGTALVPVGPFVANLRTLKRSLRLPRWRA